MSGPLWLPQWAVEIANAAKAHGIHPDLLGAIVWQESSGLPCSYRYEPAFWDHYLADKPEYAPPHGESAKSYIGERHKRRVSASYGLCQLMYSTARELGHTGSPEALFDPVTNLDLGAKLLARLLEKHEGIVREAVLAYNGGGNKLYGDAVLAKMAALGTPA